MHELCMLVSAHAHCTDRNYMMVLLEHGGGPRNHTLTKQHATAFPQNVLQKTALYAWLYCFAIRPDY
jgi:hypothetical protein